ncbi:hypothetical protein A0J47_016350 [Photobacterium damselae subsp. damselae]|uniref:hypothetical protein n=1 Tax=Photobacterium damselae TaxID=38293 RepID=UPI00083A3AD0|nr:hypothetical protein [Photobacterium damselae]QSH59297.1 hypothetical protein A0J47_016350 [Photobacterium damselae subsp. damselae]
MNTVTAAEITQLLNNSEKAFTVSILVTPISSPKVIKLAKILDIKVIPKEAGLELIINDPWRQTPRVSYFACSELVRKARPKAGDYLALYDDGKVWIVAKNDVSTVA